MRAKLWWWKRGKEELWVRCDVEMLYNFSLLSSSHWNLRDCNFSRTIFFFLKRSHGKFSSLVNNFPRSSPLYFLCVIYTSSVIIIFNLMLYAAMQPLELKERELRLKLCSSLWISFIYYNYDFSVERVASAGARFERRVRERESSDLKCNPLEYIIALLQSRLTHSAIANHKTLCACYVHVMLLLMMMMEYTCKSWGEITIEWNEYNR
jgi:hypothetical protein